MRFAVNTNKKIESADKKMSPRGEGRRGMSPEAEASFLSSEPCVPPRGRAKIGKQWPPKKKRKEDPTPSASEAPVGLTAGNG
ncbi:hypothetical protein [Pandoravirus japonicus]|uniref:Uncharacterized protein n=1 Tax=Pandoravirus japonicus TaxID=2823154 RepID=A0A811BP29_9VIRU|nr:hypothetical protein [Pandoravirus japonicus]